MFRKINWRILVRAIGDKDLTRFIQSRFGELAISEAVYENLLEKSRSGVSKGYGGAEKAVFNN